ncbi:MAG: protein tyrosine phosphatase family protein [Bryobacteraceae bacterium]
MFRRLALWTLVLATAAAAPAVPQSAQGPQADGIENFLREDANFCTGGQPTLAQLAELQKQGVRAILNLRRPEENYDAKGEEAKAKELNLRYIVIPVDSKAPTDAEADAFLTAVADPQNRPLFIHCHTANRVGAFWMIRRVLVDGWPLAKAEAEARKVGLHGPELEAFAKSYIERHAKKSD